MEVRVTLAHIIRSPKGSCEMLFTKANHHHAMHRPHFPLFSIVRAEAREHITEFLSLRTEDARQMLVSREGEI